MPGPARPSNADDDALLDAQIAYYRARASEYDAWWLRTGRFDRGPENNAAWHADVGSVERAAADFLSSSRPSNVLEIACGTGLFTRDLGGRCFAGGHCDQSGARQCAERPLCPGRPVHLAAVDALRLRLHELLAVARAARPFRRILVDGPQRVAARR